MRAGADDSGYYGQADPDVSEDQQNFRTFKIIAQQLMEAFPDEYKGEMNAAERTRIAVFTNQMKPLLLATVLLFDDENRDSQFQDWQDQQLGT